MKFWNSFVCLFNRNPMPILPHSPPSPFLRGTHYLQSTSLCHRTTIISRKTISSHKPIHRNYHISHESDVGTTEQHFDEHRRRVLHLVERIKMVPLPDRSEFLNLLTQEADDEEEQLAASLPESNCLLMALVLSDEPDRALSLFSSMPSRGLVPDSWTYSAMIRCYCRKGLVDDAKALFDSMVANGSPPSAATSTELINAYCKKGRVRKAFEVFESMIGNAGCDPTIQTYNCLLKGLCYVGRVEEALQMLGRIKNSDAATKPDIYSYTAVMDGFCKVGRSNEAKELLDEAVKSGLVPNAITYNTLFTGYCKEGKPLKGIGLLRQMKCSPDIISYTTLIHGLLKWGKVRAALKVYREMIQVKEGLALSEKMMNVFVRELCRASLKESDLLRDAHQVFDEMRTSGFSIDNDTYELAVSTLCAGKKSNEALVVMEKMRNKEYQPRRITYEWVIRALCKEGNLDDAVSVLVVMREEYGCPSKKACDILIKEFNRQGLLSCSSIVYAAALRGGLIPENKPFC